MDVLVYFGNCLGLKQSCLILNENNWIFMLFIADFAVDFLPVKEISLFAEDGL